MAEDEKTKEPTKFEKRTGIEPKDLLKAPVEPPKIKDKKPPTAKQKYRFIVGIFILAIGIVCSPLNVYLSVIVSLIGLTVIVVSVMVRPTA